MSLANLNESTQYIDTTKYLNMTCYVTVSKLKTYSDSNLKIKGSPLIKVCFTERKKNLVQFEQIQVFVTTLQMTVKRLDFFHPHN